MVDPGTPPTIIRDVVARALAEDLTPIGDITSSLLPPDITGHATFIARAEGVLAGSDCAIETFAQIDPSIKVNWLMHDGTEVGVDDVFGEVEGPLASIMCGERTARNFLSHMCGVATLTRRYVRAAQNKTRIRDSRFTTPGLRTLEKAAVRAGGGVNHRGSLSDGILLRDKHLTHISVVDAVRRARLRWPGRFIEVECHDIDEAAAVLESKPDMILLEAVGPAEVKSIVDMISGACPVEVFGAIDIRDVGAYVAAGVDFLSVTTLTQAPPAFEVGFEVKAR
jgi:nicotinate-nucleotide pyrophosphorylase (carboxylating)